MASLQAGHFRALTRPSQWRQKPAQLLAEAFSGTQSDNSFARRCR